MASVNATTRRLVQLLSSATSRTKAQTARSRVSKSLTKSQTSVARVEVFSPGVGFNPISEDFIGNPAEFESGFGQGYDDFTLPVLVVVSTVKSQTARARVQATVTRTQTSTARVSKSLTKAQTAKVRVQVAGTKAQTSVARVKNAAVTKAQTARVRVQRSLTKPQTSVARIIRAALATVALAGTSSLSATLRTFHLIAPAIHGASSLSAALAAMTDRMTVSIAGRGSLAATVSHVTHRIAPTIAGTSNLSARLTHRQFAAAIHGTSSLSLTVGAGDIGAKGAHASQVALEVARSASPETRLSQITLEVARPRTGLHVWATFGN